jgi:hypothetical protein
MHIVSHVCMHADFVGVGRTNSVSSVRLLLNAALICLGKCMVYNN